MNEEKKEKISQYEDKTKKIGVFRFLKELGIDKVRKYPHHFLDKLNETRLKHIWKKK